MRKIFFLFTIVIFISCSSTNKLYKKYALYKRDRELNYPKENLEINLLSNKKGEFIRIDIRSEVFKQEFNYTTLANRFLIIDDLSIKDSIGISLNIGDTIVYKDKQLHFFYEGEKIYLLSFKRKAFVGKIEY